MASALLHLGVLTVCWTQGCFGFNLDERFPVIKQGPTKGSLFGLSVALHEQVNPDKSLLLVGAPKDKPRSLPKVNETGAVYYCPVTKEMADCTRMDLVSSTSANEMVDGMWLGVTVASQRDLPGGRVLACGHRYSMLINVRGEEQRSMIGKCFVRGNDLQLDPLDDWQDYTYQMCDPNQDFELEGMCNMGISAGMTDTDFYAGSPGSFLWQGNVHIANRSPDPENAYYTNVKNFRESNKRERHSYTGYAVLEGKRLLERNSFTVVMGSPRDEARGSVTLGRKTDSSIEHMLTLAGEQLGSYFGCSLAVTDLNNDSWNDLIVGAPFYFDRAKDLGGAVYVFMNENGSFQKTASKVLKGPVASGFGLAVAAIGDVNQDGFQDFAAGAPFHDTGVVYIWMGSKEGISEEFSQAIEGKHVGNGGFRTFGYSISGGLDMDGNRYPDILIGSLDDRVALLRARPVVHISKNFTVQPNILDPNECSSRQPCITVNVCLSYTLSNGVSNFKEKITISYTVEADKVRRRSSRVCFLANNEDVYSGQLTLTSSGPSCQTLEVTVVVPVRDKLEPVVFALNMSLQEQSPSAGPSLQNLDRFPVLSQNQMLTRRAEMTFLKECGADSRCSSNLQLAAMFVNEREEPYSRQGINQVLQYNSSVKRVWLQVEVTNLPSPGRVAEDAHSTLLNISMPGTLGYYGVRSADHDVECHFEGVVICELGNPLKSNERVSLTVIFQVTGISLDTREIQLNLLLSTLSEQADLRPVPLVLIIENTVSSTFFIDKPEVVTSFSGKVKGESAMVRTSDIGSLVEFTFSVEVSGPPLGHMGTLSVDFQWPYEVPNGKWLLYLTEIVLKGTTETHCKPPGDALNLLNLTVSESSDRRSRRQVGGRQVGEGHVVVTPQPLIKEPQAAITLATPRKVTYLLDCSIGTARCVRFTCPLLHMNNSAKIIVRSRVWNSTMLEDYSNAIRVVVKGQATLKLVTEKPTIKMNSIDIHFTVNMDPVLSEVATYKAPLWIYMVAAAAGLLVLGAISLALWKLGFFQRASYYRAMPKHRGVKVAQAERCRLNLGFQSEEHQTRYWITSWTEMQPFYY